MIRKKSWCICFLVLFGVHPYSKMCEFGVRWTFLVRTSYVWESLYSVYFITRLLSWQHSTRLTAEVRGCCSWTGQRRTSWLKSSWDPEGWREGDCLSSLFIRQKERREDEIRHIQIFDGEIVFRFWPAFWLHPVCSRLLALQSHLLKSLWLACLWRELFVSAKRWVAEWTAGPISLNPPRLTNQHSETRQE